MHTIVYRHVSNGGGAGGGGGGVRPTSFWHISYPYLDQGGHIIPTQYCTPPPDFQTLRHGVCTYNLHSNLANIKAAGRFRLAEISSNFCGLLRKTF